MKLEKQCSVKTCDRPNDLTADKCWNCGTSFEDDEVLDPLEQFRLAVLIACEEWREFLEGVK